MKGLRVLHKLVMTPVEALLLPPFLLACLASRLSPRPVDVGLGPQPLINNVYHKLALEQHGYRAETFVYSTFFITSEFDVSYAGWKRNPLLAPFVAYAAFLRAIFRYKALFIYFNGGPLMHMPLYRALEPYLLKLAGVKVVVMPYGSDVQVMTRSQNAHFKHVMSQDYPAVGRGYRAVERQVDRWTRHADRVISGCEWVDYTPFWHTLMLGHFSIDTDRWVEAPPPARTGSFKIFHAPNHMAIKGTEALRSAVETLRAEGLDVELVMLRGVPNDEIKKAIAEVDLVADQFVIGWYAMFAIEAMAMGKPVLCYLRPDLQALYEKAGLVAPGEIPLINTDSLHIAEAIRWAYEHRDELEARGRRGPAFVRKHHSTRHVGGVFAAMLEGLGLRPSMARAAIAGPEPTHP